ncbi:MAG: DUF1361 domain-containing protein [Anaerolineales bacterium]|jgi:uncharacterized membrane protein
MLSRINRLHRFFSSQLLYPLILSSLLALGLFAARVIVSRNTVVYRNLVWNLFLAWLPYLFSVWAAASERISPGKWWLLILPGGLWLIFFPNAPYLMTDFLHLEQRPSIPLWYDILLITSFAWSGLFLAIGSLRTMQLLIKKYLGGFISWLFVAVALGISGLGIYLGRFERWNSWDLILQPRRILHDLKTYLVAPTDNLRFFVFTLLFTTFLLICYLTFIAVRRADESEGL